MADLNQILARFGFVTVMKPKFYSLSQNVEDEEPIFEIDSLRISNITQEGPSKTVKGGLYGNTQMRYGKTMRLEMEDVVGRIEVLQYLMGAKVVAGGPLPVAIDKVERFTANGATDVLALEFTPETTPIVVKKIHNGVTSTLTPTDDYGVDGKVITLTADSATVYGDIITVDYKTKDSVARVQITDKFAPAYQIMGQTFVIDSVTGNKEWINIYIPQFLPDSIFSQTMESEGDFGAISIAGDILANDCGIFYEFLIEDTPPTNC